jgi:hypothetical protein
VNGKEADIGYMRNRQRIGTGFIWPRVRYSDVLC